jgi:hypothetical protein
MSIWDTENQTTIDLLQDMGFRPYDDIPYWIQELVNTLIDLGWRKK